MAKPRLPATISRKRQRARKRACDIEALAAKQGVKPVTDPRELIGDFWPEEESVDEFLAARQRWQQQARERSH